jgi:hypothetical protein
VPVGGALHDGLELEDALFTAAVHHGVKDGGAVEELCLGLVPEAVILAVEALVPVEERLLVGRRDRPASRLPPEIHLSFEAEDDFVQLGQDLQRVDRDVEPGRQTVGIPQLIAALEEREELRVERPEQLRYEVPN